MAKIKTLNQIQSKYHNKCDAIFCQLDCVSLLLLVPMVVVYVGAFVNETIHMLIAFNRILMIFALFTWSNQFEDYSQFNCIVEAISIFK